MSYLESAIEIANSHPAIPDGPISERDLESLAECAYRAISEQGRLVHVAAHDVPRLLREIVRLRGGA